MLAHPPDGSVVVVVVVPVGVTSRVNRFVWLSPSLSVALASRVQLPSNDGVPEKVPDVPNVRPGQPLNTELQVYGPVPPVAVSGWE